jgi:hypothetical protein
MAKKKLIFHIVGEKCTLALCRPYISHGICFGFNYNIVVSFPKQGVKSEGDVSKNIPFN